MGRRVFTLFLLLCLWIPVCAETPAYRVEDIPMVHLQNKKQYVSNPDGILSQPAVSQIDQILYELEQTTGIQTLVVAVRNIESGDCFEFAYELSRKNGVGQQKKDNGLVILLVTEERCIQFATGYGLEGDLPDAVCKQIQMRYMNEAFSKAQWDEGLLKGIQAIRQRLEGTGEPLTGSPDSKNSGLLLILILGCCFVLVPLLLWMNTRRRRRCPVCHKHTLHQLSTRTLSNLNGIRTEEIVFRCSHCGHVERRRQQRQDEDDSTHHHGRNGGPFLGGPFFGDGFGGSRNGGGFEEGSFGGGDFGGGGAGSKF